MHGSIYVYLAHGYLAYSGDDSNDWGIGEKSTDWMRIDEIISATVNDDALRLPEVPGVRISINKNQNRYQGPRGGNGLPELYVGEKLSKHLSLYIYI